MTEITKTLISLFLPFFMLLSANALRAGEWSDAQKEVWKNAQTYWALYAISDAEGFLSYVHPDYVGWSNSSVLPGSKERMAKFVTLSLQSNKTLVYDIQPLTVKVLGDVAFVNYYYTQIMKNAEGKQKVESGRWTDILKKQDDKWLLIGDHGGETTKE